MWLLAGTSRRFQQLTWRKTWRKPELHLLCYSFSFIQWFLREAGNLVTFLTDKLPLFPRSVLLRLPQYLSSIPSGSWQLQQKQPFLYSWGESDQQGNVLERGPGSLHGAQVRQPVGYRWKTQPECCQYLRRQWVPLLLSSLLETSHPLLFLKRIPPADALAEMHTEPACEDWIQLKSTDLWGGNLYFTPSQRVQTY